MKLYRPTGQIELGLVLDADLLAWPPRLPDQPIFYPVLNFEYAAEIASKWNTKSERLVGYVTEFEVDDEHASKYERQVVGADVHEELWVPAERLSELNRFIRAPIEVVAAYFGEGFVGHVPAHGPLSGLPADAQYDVVAGLSKPDLDELVCVDKMAVFLHFPRWLSFGETEALRAVRDAWDEQFPRLPLPLQRTSGRDGARRGR